MTQPLHSTVRIRNAARGGQWLTLCSCRLVCKKGPDQGREWVLNNPHALVGTVSHADVRLQDQAVSREHAKIDLIGEQWKVSDLGSTNGVRINGARVELAVLERGTVLCLGKSHLEVVPQEQDVLILPSDQLSFHGLVGHSMPMKQLFATLDRLASLNISVLLAGPTGTGKGAVARALHQASPRSHRPFAVLDCAGLDRQLVGSALFGHVKGAFTGAEANRAGIFEAAQGGTVFIDEIGDLPLELQPRLLRVLEDREVTPLGSQQSLRVDVRVIAATHRDLKAMTEKNQFREDLYYRLCVVELAIPALKDRTEDIAPLAEHFLEGLGAGHRLPLSPTVVRALQAYPWPGNIRELRNVMEKAHALGPPGPWKPEDLQLDQGRVPGGTAPASGGTPAEQLASAEREVLARTLETYSGNRTHAAKALGMSVTTLRKKMREYDLE